MAAPETTFRLGPALLRFAPEQREFVASQAKALLTPHYVPRDKRRCFDDGQHPIHFAESAKCTQLRRKNRIRKARA